jgi:hypothetical protein
MVTKPANKIKFLLPYLFLFSLSSFFVILKSPNELLFLYFGFIVIFLFSNKWLIIGLYIMLLPTNGFLFSDDYLFGILNISSLVNSGALLILITHKLKSFQIINNYQQFAKRLLILLLSYLIYNSLKMAYFNLDDLNIISSVNIIIYYLLKYLPLIFIINSYSFYSKKINFNTCINLGILILFLSQIFTPQLLNAGFKATGIDYITKQYTRFSGFFDNGDANSLGAFYCMTIGYYFTLIKQNRLPKINLFFIPILVVGIILTASRTAIISLGIITVIFILNSYKTKWAYILTAGIAIVVLLTQSTLIGVLTRFDNAGSQFDISSTSSRLGKWFVYMKYFYENPTIFVYGAKEFFEVSSFNKQFIVAHNLYLQIIYNSGLTFFLILIVQYIKILKTIIIDYNKTYSYYYFIPFFLITMYVSDIGIINYFIVYIVITSERVINRKYNIYLRRNFI